MSNINEVLHNINIIYERKKTLTGIIIKLISIPIMIIDDNILGQMNKIVTEINKLENDFTAIKNYEVIHGSEPQTLIRLLNFYISLLNNHKTLPNNFKCAPYKGAGSGSVFMINDNKTQNNVKIYCLNDFFSKSNFFVDSYLHYLLQKHLNICPNFPTLHDIFVTKINDLDTTKYDGLINHCDTLKSACGQNNFGYIVTDKLQYSFPDDSFDLTYGDIFQYIYLKVVAKTKENIIFTDHKNTGNIMFKKLDNNNSLIHRHYRIKNKKNNEEFNIYISSDKLLIAMDLDDYTFNTQNNIYHEDVDIFGDREPNNKVINKINDNDKLHVELLRGLLLSAFNHNTQLDILIGALNDSIPPSYKTPLPNTTYRTFSIEY